MTAKKPMYLPNHGPAAVVPFDQAIPVGKTGMRIPSWRLQPVSTAFVSTNAATKRSSPIMVDLTAPAGAVIEKPVIRQEEPMFATSGHISRVTRYGALAVVPTPNWPSMRAPYPMRAGDPNIPRAARPVPVPRNYRPQGGVLAGFYGAATSAISHVQGAFALAAQEQPKLATAWNARRLAAPSRYANSSTQDAVADALYLLSTARADAAYKKLKSYYNAVNPSPLPAVVAQTSTRTSSRRATATVTVKTGIGWRDVTAPGGYTYRQYKRGDIVVRSGPALVGQRITQSSDPARWTAITKEIGSWSTYRAAKTRARGSGFDVDTVTQILNVVASATGAGSGSSAAAEPAEVYEEPVQSDTSKLILYGGAGLLGVLGLGLAISAMRKP